MSPSVPRPGRPPHPLVPLLLAATLAAFASLAASHTWITVPHTYNRNYPTKRCRGSECTNACPYIMRRNRMLNLPDRPEAIWKRGQRVELAWARNNHHGGFVRFSIVPQPLIFSRAAHKRFTWFHTCWQAGQYNCKDANEPCGTDKKHNAFRRFVKVPKVFPDGDYVLGFVWYGGLHYKEWKGQFPDYYSCTFIRIQGGPMEYTPFKPFFFTGTKEGRGVKNGLCRTSSSTVGKCHRWGCPKKKYFYSKPSVFWDKKGPPALKVPTIKKALTAKTWFLHLLWGNCNYRVCCPRRCGATCGGPLCKTGGRNKHECCTLWIQRSGRQCRYAKPPCVRH